MLAFMGTGDNFNFGVKTDRIAINTIKNVDYLELKIDFLIQ